MKAVVNVKLSETKEGKFVSILDLPGDILIVPQATLGGKIKGKVMQYHGNVDKADGHDLYTEFVDLCQQTYKQNEKCKETGTEVKFGTYGNRQVLTVDTNGPFTHLIEI